MGRPPTSNFGGTVPPVLHRSPPITITKRVRRRITLAATAAEEDLAVESEKTPTGHAIPHLHTAATNLL